MALIFVTRNLPGDGLQQLRDSGHEVVVHEEDRSLTNAELLERLAERPYEGVVTLLSDTVDAAFFDAAPQVQIVSNYAVGYNNIDTEEATKRGVVVTNTPGVLTDTVAEYTIALLLAITKRVPESEQYLRAGKYEGWAPELFLGTDLKGKTLGILGAGRIGTAVAARAHRGFGMKILYSDVKQCEELEHDVPCEFVASTDEVLAQADIVSIHVPLLEATHHLINAERLALMKPTAYLINTSRGPVIDEAALVAALQNQTIRGAALDVFEEEPTLAPGLSELANVVITPHIASASHETRNKMSTMVAENQNNFFAGTSVPNQVTT